VDDNSNGHHGGVLLEFDGKPFTEPVTPELGGGAKILDVVREFIRRFVHLSDEQATIVAVWTAHTHGASAATATPYLAITSATKQSGKTRLLEVLELLVCKPWLTGKVSAACLVRKVDHVRPTLLLDESDAAFAGEQQYAEALRGILNTGFYPGGAASCCVGQGANTTYKDFRTYTARKLSQELGNCPIPSLTGLFRFGYNGSEWVKWSPGFGGAKPKMPLQILRRKSRSGFLLLLTD